ncbi:hypothetical protein RJT34_09522 [Clitoria ternatea]|uniref:Uncharacterized protein n=1 Tax=Clitoria ternatea TaxID=43366 RepID=A0AAN9K5R4_CLITE
MLVFRSPTLVHQPQAALEKVTGLEGQLNAREVALEKSEASLKDAESKLAGSEDSWRKLAVRNIEADESLKEAKLALDSMWCQEQRTILNPSLPISWEGFDPFELRLLRENVAILWSLDVVIFMPLALRFDVVSLLLH